MKDLTMRKNEKNKSVINICLCAAAGFIFSGGNVLNCLYPFLPAFLSAAPLSFGIPALIGGMIGCLILSPLEVSVFYIVICANIMLVKFLIKLFFKKENIIINCSVAFCVSVLRTVGILFSSSVYIPDAILGISESFMTAGFCYFFSIAINLYLSVKDKNEHIFTDMDGLSLLVSALSLIISLNAFSFEGVHIGTVVSVILILSFAFVNSETYLLISVAVAFALSINNLSSLAFFAILPVSILLISPVRRLGKYAFSLTFVITSVFLSTLLNFDYSMLSLFLEAVIGSVLFAAIPLSEIKKLSSLSSGDKDTPLKSILTEKLKNASSSMDLLADALEALCPKKNIYTEIQNGEIISEVSGKLCKNCRLSATCWGVKFNDTADLFNKAVNSLKVDKPFKTPTFFINACHNHKQILSEISDTFSRKKENKKQEGALLHVKNAVSESYRSLSFLLDEFSKEIEIIYREDKKGAVLLKNTLNSMSIKPLSYSAITLNGGKTVYEFLLKKPISDEISAEIIKNISAIRREKYSLPVLISTENGYLYSFSECENYFFSYSELYLSKKDDEVSGDKITLFSSKDGFQYLLLCDGMGSGKYAAREAEIASLSIKELICGGLTHRAAVNTVGTMLLSQEDNETSCAIDMLKIDKYTAEGTFFKAGSAASLVRRDGRVSEISSNSMPIGIIGEIDYSETKLYFSPGDIILMLSDGALESGTDWLSGILSQKRIKTAEELKTDILDYVEKNGITFTDDASMGILVVEKN